MTAGRLFGVFVFFLLARSFGGLWVGPHIPLSPYYLDLAMGAAMHVGVVVFCIVYFRIRGSELKGMFGSLPGLKSILAAVGIAIVLLGFQLGEAGLGAFTLAQWHPDLAYGIWNFKAPDGAGRHGPFTLHVAAYILYAVVLVAVAEEIFFRRLMLGACVRRWGLHAGVLVGALFFTVLHIKYQYFVGTLAFAVVVSYLYIATGSLWLPIATHLSFNLLAFLHQYYFDIHWTKLPEEIALAGSWVPQWVMLAASVPALVAILCILIRVGRARAASGDRPAPWAQPPDHQGCSRPG